MNIYLNKTIREADQKLINDRGFPNHTLMEIAGFQIAQDLSQRLEIEIPIFIFIGPGNNGGDGLVIARWLFHWKFKTHLIMCSEINSQSAKLNRSLLDKNIPVADLSKLQTPNQSVFIDALLGNGQTREPSDSILNAVHFINQNLTNVTTLITIDTPTGRDPDSGCSFNNQSLSPSICYSIGGRTKGLFHRELDMEIVDIDIALPLKSHQTTAQLLDQQVWNMLPPINRNNAKWDKGHVAIAATGGAAILAGTSALRSGVGLVSIVCPKDDWHTLRELPPEIMIIEPWQVSPNKHDVLVVGPNWGFETEKETLVIEWWNNFPNPLLLDADGITILSQSIQPVSHPRILTPHTAEAARILNRSRSNIEDQVFNAAIDLSEYGVAVLKGPHTLIQSQTKCWISPFRDSKLAIAGSGDVLSGLIGGFCAQKKIIETSVLLGVYIHAFSGTKLNFGDGASDLISSIHKCIRDYRNNTT